MSSLRADRDSVQRRLDSVLRENATLKGDVEALHEELCDMRRELMSLKMARLKAPSDAAGPSSPPPRADSPPLPQREPRQRRRKPSPAPPRNPNLKSDRGMEISPPREREREGNSAASPPSSPRTRRGNGEGPVVQPLGLKDFESLLKAHRRETDRQLTERLAIFYDQVVNRLSVRPRLGGDPPKKKAEEGASAEAGSSGPAALSAAQAPASVPFAKAGDSASSKKAKKKGKKARGGRKDGGGGQRPGAGVVAKATPQTERAVTPNSCLNTA
ncbi:uncharacterized protein LOC109862523 [Pseudomyrmex gracilis]|uniref:uncharacterized protein LOC109862523 n=1 Tax=Pseudomyrmex gracilis TaxID=219809 RepID=UPI000994AB4F|nr:uncharacterized protein LOC109862523 [Pseudomyrmex gracilis]